jgi:hypothetical protein
MSKGKGTHQNPAEEYLRQVNPDKPFKIYSTRIPSRSDIEPKYRYRIIYDHSKGSLPPYARGISSCLEVFSVLAFIIFVAGFIVMIFFAHHENQDGFSIFLLVLFLLTGGILAAAGRDAQRRYGSTYNEEKKREK